MYKSVWNVEDNRSLRPTNHRFQQGQVLNAPNQNNVQPTVIDVDTNNLNSIPTTSVSNETKLVKISLIIIGSIVGICLIATIIVLSIFITKPTVLQPTFSIPTGTIIFFAGNVLSLPEPADRWLLCNGSTVSRFVYQDLFNVIGTTFGSGNGIDTFNLPDFRSRFPLGSNGNSLVTGGNPMHTLTVAELPSHDHDQGSLTTFTSGAHSHNINDPGHDHGGSTGLAPYSAGTYPMGGHSGGAGDDNGFHSHSISTDYTGVSIQSNGDHIHSISGLTGSRGSNQPIDMMPPYQTINYIIRAS